jgi:hypothetical protein
VKLLEVLLKETTIYQDTKWKKKGLDWADFAAEFVRNHAINRVTKQENTVAIIQAQVDAWRKANPRGRPEAAWTALGGRGPAPEPEKEISGADLRIEPPDDSGDWIDFGDKWQNTKMTPTGFAIKPNPRRPTTWGPNWKSADQQIADIKKQNKKISDDEVTKQLKDLHDSKGRRKYSDNEIAEAWAIIQQYDVIDKIQDQFAVPKPKYNKETKTWSCKDGWTYDTVKKICVKNEEEDPTEPGPAPEPYPGADGNPTCKKGWKYDAKEDACVRDTSVVVTPAPTPNTDTAPKPVKGEDGKFRCETPWVYDETTKSCVKKTETPPPVVVKPPKPVAGPDGKFTCEAPWVYDETTKSCVKKGETTPPVVVKPPGNISIIMPSGTKADLNANNPYDSENHKGVDIVVPVGTKVVAPEDGKVTAINSLDKDKKRVFGKAGLFLNFTSTDGKRVHKFFHLSEVTEFGGADKLQLPFPFSKGQTLALSGGKPGAYGSGNSKGPHLHWEVYVEGVNVNPMSLFPPDTN